MAEGNVDEACYRAGPLSSQPARYRAQHRAAQVVLDERVGEELDDQRRQVQRRLDLPAGVAERLVPRNDLVCQAARTPSSSTDSRPRVSTGRSCMTLAPPLQSIPARRARVAISL